MKAEKRIDCVGLGVKGNHEEIKPASGSEPPQSADQDVSGVQPAFCVAQKMGARLGHRALLLRCLPKKRENKQEYVKTIP